MENEKVAVAESAEAAASVDAADKMKADLTAQQVSRCVPVAKKILALIAAADLPIGEIKKEEVDSLYDAVVNAALTEMLAGDIHIGDLDYLLNAIRQPIDLFNNRLTHALKITLDNAGRKKWSKEILDVTFKELDEFLRS